MSAQLMDLAFAFMLVLCRCGGMVMLMPGLGEEDLPAMIRAGLAIVIAVLLTPLARPSLPAAPPELMPLAAMLAKELLAGGLIGWLARTLALALPIAGQVISLMTGLSSVLQQDATLGAQSAAIGKLFNLLVPVVFLASGLYALPLQAVAGSYAVLPAGGPAPSGDLLEIAVRSVSGSFALGLRLAAPFILASLVWQAGLGLLSRLVPQIQVYFASLPGQVLGGLCLVAILSATLVSAWLDALRQGLAQLPGL